jgi:hypothetical protein
MATIDDYFSIDNDHNITCVSETTLSSSDGRFLPVKIFQNLAAGACYFAIRIPFVDDTLSYCLGLIDGNLVETLMDASPKVVISSTSRPVDTTDLKFCGRIYIYAGVDLTEEEISLIHSKGLKKGLFIEYFGPSWVNKRSTFEKPLAFISHDSRDKESIAKPLALKLAGLGIRVWYDEFSLKIGDSLRESIEKGIRETNFCILVITKNFLTNKGWTKAEFNSVFTREILQKEKIILPIWHDVSPQDVYEYSPSLVDRLAANWSEGEMSVATKIKNRIQG